VRAVVAPAVTMLSVSTSATQKTRLSQSLVRHFTIGLPLKVRPRIILCQAALLLGLWRMLLLWFLVIALALELAVSGWRLQQVRAGDAQVCRRISAVLDNLSVGLSVWDADQRLVACNERFRE